MAKKLNPEQKQQIDHEQLGKMLTNIYETGYIDRNQAYKMSFIKGMFTGLGGVIGATLVVALIVAVLSLPIFENLPPVEWVRTSIESKTGN